MIKSLSKPSCVWHGEVRYKRTTAYAWRLELERSGNEICRFYK
ncbi:MAG: hypothetical protein PUH24_05215 [Prevotellaceae bacterium]|nr:hypothetical protein [Prevotellaceae bacterium]MDY6131281.1 hypothetical protein [Prevotella sp.]